MFLTLLTVGYGGVPHGDGQFPDPRRHWRSLTGLCRLPAVRYRQPDRQGHRARALAHRRTVVGDHRRLGRHLVRVDHRRCRGWTASSPHMSMMIPWIVTLCAVPLALLGWFLARKRPGRGTGRGNEYSRLTRRPMTGRVLSSPAVYGCAGWSNTSYTSPVSSRRPAYMTATLSAICATTPKSWVMNSTESRIRPSATSAGRGSAPPRKRRTRKRPQL